MSGLRSALAAAGVSTMGSPADAEDTRPGRSRVGRHVPRTVEQSRPGQPVCQYPVVSVHGHVSCAWPGRAYRVTGMPASGRSSRLIMLCRRHLDEVLAAGYQVSRAAPEELGCEHRMEGRACGEPAREVRVEGGMAGFLRLCPAHEAALADSGVRVIELPPIARIRASRRAG